MRFLLGVRLPAQMFSVVFCNTAPIPCVGLAFPSVLATLYGFDKVRGGRSPSRAALIRWRGERSPRGGVKSPKSFR